MSNLFSNAAENLEKSIETTLDAKRLIPLIHCLSAATITTDELGEVIEESNGVSKFISNGVLSILHARINRDEFESMVRADKDKMALLEKFDLSKRAYFFHIDKLLFHYDENFAIIQKHIGILGSKKTQSIKKDKWGRLDESGWITILRDFSNEMLIGNGLINIFDTLPEKVRIYLDHKNALDLFPRFVWLISEINKENISSQNKNEFISNKAIGMDFEEKIKTLIEESNPKAIVETTPASGDQGADLIVYIDSLKIVIQAKKYTGNVGNSAVQEVYSAKNYMGAHAALVVTNSDYTRSARELAAGLKVMLLYEQQVSDFFAQL